MTTVTGVLLSMALLSTAARFAETLATTIRTLALGAAWSGCDARIEPRLW